MNALNLDLIRFEPGSVVDPVGRVFHFDGRIFRAISPGHLQFVEQTLKLASELNWSDAGLIPTWRSLHTLPGYPCVIEHQRVPFVTLRGEWSGEGLRNAALCILKASAKLLQSDLCLKDAHPWNVLFDGVKPYFVDWGSIRPIAELDWKFWYRQFRQYLLAPLYAFSIGEHRIGRAMLREHKVGVGNEIIDLPRFVDLPDVPNHIASIVNTTPSAITFELLIDYVTRLNIPHTNGEWTTYAQPQLPAYADFDSLREKDRIVHRILIDDSGKSLIDIGTNNGLHSEIAASLGKKVLACDIEETCLNFLYTRIQNRRSDILPLYHDFLWPIGSSGILNTIPGAEDRLSCDTALVMAVTHHLAFKQNVSFDAMARGLSALAHRRAIVEFVPAEDEHVALWSPERLPWYTLDNFIVAMRQYFKNHAVIASEPSPRCVIVFEK